MDLYVLFKLFFVQVIADFITGIMAAAKEGRLKSRTCSDGMFRSLGEVIVLVLAVIISTFLPELHGVIITFMIGFMVKEAISIVENLTRLGVWIPATLTKWLNITKEKYDNEGDVK